jgi:hypothetical protein
METCIESPPGVTLLAWSVTDFLPQSTLLHSNCLNRRFGNTQFCASQVTFLLKYFPRSSQSKANTHFVLISISILSDNHYYLIPSWSIALAFLLRNKAKWRWAGVVRLSFLIDRYLISYVHCCYGKYRTWDSFFLWLSFISLDRDDTQLCCSVTRIGRPMAR